MTNPQWDVDLYKTEHECDEHWELRRSFIVAHQNDFEEEKLICLAQVFTNVEFLGCSYPEKTMRLVADLSKGIVESYREKRKGKLKRTFMGASAAAENKAKKRR